jgi:hypothetical protein
MKIRRSLLALFVVALGASAQGPGPGRGPGRMGFPPPDGRGGPGVPGGPGARFLGAEAGMPGRTVKNAPFSGEMVTETTQTLPDGNRIHQSSSVKMFRDSEGRTRREQAPNLNGLTSSANMPTLVFINDPVAGVNMALNAKDKTGSRNTFTPRTGQTAGTAQVAGRGPGRGPGQRGPQEANAVGAPRARRQTTDPNFKTEDLGTRSFDGVMAEGRRTTLTIPAGQMGNEFPISVVHESWYSKELETMVYSKRTDPRSGETVTRLSNVSRSEPSRTLFDAPSDYTVTESVHGGPRARTGSPAKQ